MFAERMHKQRIMLNSAWWWSGATQSVYIIRNIFHILNFLVLNHEHELFTRNLKVFKTWSNIIALQSQFKKKLGDVMLTCKNDKCWVQAKSSPLCKICRATLSLSVKCQADSKKEVNQQQYYSRTPKHYYGLWPITISRYFIFLSAASIF